MRKLSAEDARNKARDEVEWLGLIRRFRQWRIAAAVLVHVNEMRALYGAPPAASLEEATRELVERESKRGDLARPKYYGAAWLARQARATLMERSASEYDRVRIFEALAGFHG